MLISDPRLGDLPSPLSALVLHFGESGSTKKPCEAAFVGDCKDGGITPPNVYILCSPSNYTATSKLYRDQTQCKRVYPLYFTEEDIDAQSLLSLMAVDESGHMPLYMQVVMSILSELGGEYTYAKFKAKIDRHPFDAHQRGSLQLRLTLLETFLCQRLGEKLYDIRTKKEIQQPKTRFYKGRLTVVDLTDPWVKPRQIKIPFLSQLTSFRRNSFISPGTACSLFEIVLKLFNRCSISTGKVVILDEAHKVKAARASVVPPSN
jgi:hypothetical protein